MRPAVQLIATLLLLATAAHSQTTRLGKSCDLASVGAASVDQFLAFDRELRLALEKQDPTATALLVQFPLRVNASDGSYSLNNPEALQSRFHQVSSPAVRQTILKQKPADLFCNDSGIMYAGGTLWIAPTQAGFAIQTVNLPAEPVPDQPRTEFVCRTTTETIAIVTEGKNTIYRSWTKPHSATEKPDLEIPNGSKRFEGTGPCAHPIWTFTAAGTTYTLEAAGCTETPDPPAATLRVAVRGNPPLESACH